MLLNINPGFCDKPKITRLTYVLRIFTYHSSWGQRSNICYEQITQYHILDLHGADDHFSLLTDGRILQFQTALVGDVSLGLISWTGLNVRMILC